MFPFNPSLNFIPSWQTVIPQKSPLALRNGSTKQCLLSISNVSSYAWETTSQGNFSSYFMYFLSNAYNNEIVSTFELFYKYMKKELQRQIWISFIPAICSNKHPLGIMSNSIWKSRNNLLFHGKTAASSSICFAFVDEATISLGRIKEPFHCDCLARFFTSLHIPILSGRPWGLFLGSSMVFQQLF